MTISDIFSDFFVHIMELSQRTTSGKTESLGVTNSALPVYLQGNTPKPEYGLTAGTSYTAFVDQSNLTSVQVSDTLEDDSGYYEITGVMLEDGSIDIDPFWELTLEKKPKK